VRPIQQIYPDVGRFPALFASQLANINGEGEEGGSLQMFTKLYIVFV